MIYRLKMYEGIFLEINISFDERIIIGDYELQLEISFVLIQ